MFVFYDSNGVIKHAIEADSPDVAITNLPSDGTTSLYVIDSDYPQLRNNLPEYKIQNGVPVYTPIADSVKLADAKQKKLTELKEIRDGVLIGGFASTTTGHTYYSAPSDQMKFYGQVMKMLRDTTVTSVDWLTKDAGVVTHTRDQFLGAFDDGFAFESEQHTKYDNLESQVNAATTIDAVNAISW